MSRSLLDSAHYLVCKHSRAARQRCPQRFRPGTTYAKGSCTESSVDDLGTCRGVVLSRAATILRSIETQPSTGRFVRVTHANNPPSKILLKGQVFKEVDKKEPPVPFLPLSKAGRRHAHRALDRLLGTCQCKSSRSEDLYQHVSKCPCL
jgi:hypothetical protein